MSKYSYPKLCSGCIPAYRFWRSPRSSYNCSLCTPIAAGRQRSTVPSVDPVVQFCRNHPYTCYRNQSSPR